MPVKNEVIRLLEKNREKALSGQQLAEKLGVSRAAVWKAVKTLEAEGYAIQATRNKGYRLRPESDALSEEGIRAFLPEDWKGYPVQALGQVDSTNLYARRFCMGDGPDAALVAADCQTRGRGRLGRTFYSPAGAGVYMSLMLRVDQPLTDFLLVTVAAAVAVTRALRRHTDAQPAIKWVNDVYVGDRKVCGILTEAVSDFESGMLEAVVVGVGINVHPAVFPQELAGLAGTVPGLRISRNQLIAEIAREIYTLSRNLKDPALLAAYRADSMVLGREVAFRLDGKERFGRAEDVGPDGSLLVQTADGPVTLRAGEISVRPCTRPAPHRKLPMKGRL